MYCRAQRQTHMSSIQRPPNQLLQALPAEDFELVGARLKPLQLMRETVLVEAGVAPAQIVFPHAGAVSIVVNLSEGQSVEVAMIGRDGVVGACEALGDGVSLTDAIVLFPAAASAIELADFRIVAAQSPALRGLVTRHGEALLTQAQQTAACNAKHRIPQRLATWILRAQHDSGEDELLLTQEYLAQMLGVQRASVSMFAGALQERGLIFYRRGRVRVLDRSGLEAVACECHAVLRERHEHLFRHDLNQDA